MSGNDLSGLGYSGPLGPPRGDKTPRVSPKAARKMADEARRAEEEAKKKAEKEAATVEGVAKAKEAEKQRLTAEVAEAGGNTSAIWSNETSTGAEVPTWNLWPDVDATLANTNVITRRGGRDASKSETVEQETKTLISQVLAGLADMSPDDLEEQQRKLIAAGFITKEQAATIRWRKIDDATMAGTVALLKLAAVYNSGVNNKTVEEVLTETIADPIKDPADIAQAKADAKASARKESKSVKITDPGSARATLTSALQKNLGRDPTVSEVSEFIALLNQAERARPIDTVSQGDPTAGTATTTQSGGVDASQLAENFAREGGRGAEGAGHSILDYMGSFNQMISSPGGMA